LVGGVVVGHQQLWIRVVWVEELGYSFPSTVDYGESHPVRAITEDFIYPPLYYRRCLFWVWIRSAHALLRATLCPMVTGPPLGR
jgi:hypothetical protein